MPSCFEHSIQVLQALGVANAGGLAALSSDAEHGDCALPCFALAKERGIAPQAIAQEIAQAIVPDQYIARAEAAGPFVNIWFQNDPFAREAIANAGVAHPTEREGAAPVMVEFFHANTHKAVHIGHVRNISLGESLCRLLEAQGHTVVRANYQGDIGPHVAKTLWALLQLGEYRSKIPAANRSLWLAEFYARGHRAYAEDPVAATEIKEINKKIYANDPALRAVWQETRQWCLDDFKELYKRWGVRYDRLYFESEVEEQGKALAEDLLARGVLKQSQGAIIADLQEEGLNVLVIITGDGTPLYGAKDLALAELKIKEYPGIGRSLHLVGHEQELYFQQLFAIFKRAGFALGNKSEHVVYALVRRSDGKMSSRAGNVVTYAGTMDQLTAIAGKETKARHQDWSAARVADVAETIALAGLKFSMLKSEPNKEIVFDEKEVLRFDGDTGPYLLYTYARCRSILRKAGEMPPADHVSGLTEQEERLLIRLLAQYAASVRQAARERRPNILANYLLDCAHALNGFYHKYPVLEADSPSLRVARLALVAAVAKTMQAGLRMLGIETVEEM